MNETQRNHLRPPTKKKGPTPEAKVAEKVVAYLDTITSVNLRTGAGAAQIEGRYITMGEPGQADRHVCLVGRFVAVETKAPGGKLSPKQQAYRARVEAEEGIYIVAPSVEALRAALAQHFGAAQVAVWAARIEAYKAEQRNKRRRPENRI